MERQLVFELPNDLQCIEETVEFVISRCTTCAEVERKLRLNFRVSLCEALANAMIYGNGSDPSKQVHVEVFVEGARLTARITDEGPGFDPRTVPDPTIARNLQRDGGRGIFLMRELMDEVRYNDRGNSVTLTLTLPDQNGLSHG
ncbi:MAG: ATP-binding protein, partial [Gemmatimonadota bacterium]